jgi:hypothetical protein
MPFGDGRGPVHHFNHELAEVDGSALQDEPLRLDAGRVEEVLNHALEGADPVSDAVQDLARFGRLLSARALQARREQPDGAERPAQVVRDDGDELLSQALGPGRRTVASVPSTRRRATTQPADPAPTIT